MTTSGASCSEPKKTFQLCVSLPPWTWISGGGRERLVASRAIMIVPAFRPPLRCSASPFSLPSLSGGSSR